MMLMILRIVDIIKSLRHLLHMIVIGILVLHGTQVLRGILALLIGVVIGKCFKFENRSDYDKVTTIYLIVI